MTSESHPKAGEAARLRAIAGAAYWEDRYRMKRRQIEAEPAQPCGICGKNSACGYARCPFKTAA